MSKKKKRFSWIKFSEECKDSQACDCGLSVLCYNPDNEESDLCEKESCPKLKERF